jgi:hypothetical protein
MFLNIAAQPGVNRNLIPYGILLKVSYVSIVAYYWLAGECPTLFKPFALIDAAMLVLFVVAYLGLGKTANAFDAPAKAVGK